jgi:hypothetical protein
MPGRSSLVFEALERFLAFLLPRGLPWPVTAIERHSLDGCQGSPRHADLLKARGCVDEAEQSVKVRKSPAPWFQKRLTGDRRAIGSIRLDDKLALVQRDIDRARKFLRATRY